MFSFCCPHLPHCYSEASLSVFVQAILCGNFWYIEYGLVQCSLHRPTVKVTALLQQRALPLLEKLNRLLEEKQLANFSPNTCNQPVSITQSAPDRGKTLVTGCTTYVLNFTQKKLTFSPFSVNVFQHLMCVPFIPLSVGSIFMKICFYAISSARKLI